VVARGLTLAEQRPELADIREKAIDTASILVRYSSGDLGTFVVTWGLPPGVNPAPHPDQIYGPKGLAEVEFGRADQTLRILKEGGDWETLAVCREDMYKRQIDSFAASVRGETALQVTPSEGRLVLQAAIMGLESMHINR
jgi:predicted dehydrogenase